MALCFDVLQGYTPQARIGSFEMLGTLEKETLRSGCTGYIL